MTDEHKDENEEAAEEVEEQAIKYKGHDDEAEGSDGSDDDNEVEEQKRFSDATLKCSIAPIPDACTALR